MNVIIANDNRIDDIGYQTENNRTQVRFPLADVMEEFPGGLAVLTVRRPEESTAYPIVTTEMDGTDLVWTVGAWELGVKGILSAQIVYTVGETVAKRKIYEFNVDESLINVASEPADWEDLVLELLEAASEVHGAIAEAEETLDEKVAAAEEAKEEAVTAVSHYPMISEGYWYVWDIQNGTYVNTGIQAEGTEGFSPRVETRPVPNGYEVIITDSNGPHTFTLHDGESGARDYNDLENKPSLNGQELNGDMTLEDIGALSSELKGAAGGIAELGEDGKVPYGQLPPTMDDIREYSTRSQLPARGESGILYMITTTNKLYRWAGSNYVEVSQSLQLGETSDTAFRGDHGKYAYEKAQLVDGKVDNSKVGTANGVASLGSDGKVPASQLPAIGGGDVSDVVFNGQSLVDQQGVADLTDVIPDVSGHYIKPETGIPSTDMAEAVQTSLGKADSAYQKPQTGIPASDMAEGVIPSVPVQDVQLDGTSILDEHGVAEIPSATINQHGVVKLKNSGGVYKYSDGIGIECAVGPSIKAGANLYLPICPKYQHSSVFYGLAKLAGADMAQSDNAVGVYTDDAKLKIQQMLGLWTPKLVFSATCAEEAANWGVTSRYEFQLGDVELNVWEELVVLLYQTDSNNGANIFSNNWGQVIIRDDINTNFIGHAGWLMGTSAVALRYKRFPNVLINEVAWVNSINSSTPVRTFVRSQDYIDKLRYMYVHVEGGVVNVGTRMEVYIHRFI